MQHDIYTSLCVKQTACGKLLCAHRAVSLLPCDDLEGWGGVGGLGKVLEGGDMCILMVDPYCCIAEVNTIL